MHAILDLHRKIIKSKEKHEKSCSTFLDFAKAFDTVNHDILLSKPEYYGARNILLKWFKSYLQNRQQCVKITRTSLTLLCGVPEGSVPGQHYFSLFI